MAYTVSQAYHTAIKDGISPQNFVLVDKDAPFNYLSSLDGDFVAGSISITRSVCESQDMTMGECPSAALTATLSNPYGDANQFWSKRGQSGLGTVVYGQAGIGVQAWKSTYQSEHKLYLALFTEDNTIYVRNGALVITAQADASISGDTLTFGSTAPVSISGNTLTITDTNDVAVYVDSSGKLYVGSNYATGYSNAVSLHALPISASSYYVYIGMSDGTVKRMTVNSGASTMPSISTLSGASLPGGIMCRKMSEINQTAIYDYHGFPSTVRRYANGLCTEENWEFCPVGVYILNPPKYSLNSTYIDITDAMDYMSLLDCNLLELAEANSFSIATSADTIINNICSAKAIPLLATYSVSPYTIPVTEDMITADTTCRQFFKWVGERVGHMWKMDPVGRLEVYRPASFAPSTDYSLDDDYLVAGFEIYNEFVDPPQKLVVYYGEEGVYTSQASSPTRDDFYKITGNPLYSDPDDQSPVLPWLGYSDLPLKSYQLADCMTVAADPSYGYGDALIIDSATGYETYIMQETISFGIRATAHYTATGSETRRDVNISSTNVMIGAMGERIDEMPDVIGEQTGNQISQAIQDAIAAGGAIDSAISSATQGLISASDVNSQLDAIRSSLIDANTIAQMITDELSKFTSELHQYIVWDDTNGLSIKALDDDGLPSQTYLNLQAEILGFMFNGARPAWMTSDTFNINNLITHVWASIVGLIIQEVDVGGVKHLRIS